jgi:cation diffusion facilitator family transporter
LLGTLYEMFRSHSHDSAESIDRTLESSERGIRAVWISFTALAVTAVAQVGVVLVTGSVALLADTVHNFADALTAVPLYVAFRLSRRPANRRYTYGYRRAEDLAGVFVLAMIAMSAIAAAWQALNRLVDPRPLEHVGVLIAAGLIGLAGNELVALYRIREGTAIGSAALVADGYHARTDGLASLAVALAALGAWAGLERADPIVGLVISAAIFAGLWGAARQIYYRLMDAVDPALVDQIAASVCTVPNVRAVEPPRVRWLGHRLVSDLTITVPADQSVGHGHATAEAVRHRLLHEIPNLADAHVHVDPDDTHAHDTTRQHAT